MHRTFDFKFWGLFLVDRLFVFIFLISKNSFGDGGVFLVIHEVARLFGMPFFFHIYFASGDISNSMGGGRDFVPVDPCGGILSLAVRNQRAR